MRVVNTANPPAGPYDFGTKACSNSLMTRKSVGSPIVNAIRVTMSPRRLRSSMNLAAIWYRGWGSMILGRHARIDRRRYQCATSGAVTTPSRLSAWSPCGMTAGPRRPSSTCHWAPHLGFHSGAGSCRFPPPTGKGPKVSTSDAAQTEPPASRPPYSEQAAFDCQIPLGQRLGANCPSCAVYRGSAPSPSSVS